MTHLQLFGIIIEHLGKELQKPDSHLSRHFILSSEQFCALLQFTRIMTAPSVQTLYMHDLAHRWRKTPKTIYNWIELGFLHKGHKRAHDTRTFWYASEIDEAECALVAYGYLTPRQGAVMRLIERCRKFLRFDDCK